VADCNRKEINDKIVSWIINKVKTEYADDISIVLIYGSYVNGTANRKSDVDCYFIPKTDYGYNMAADFIIDGVGYDIFPMSWERVEGIADLNEVLTPLVGDVQIIYYSNSDDLQRFRNLQSRLKSNLYNDEYVRKIAAKKCEDANRICAVMTASHEAVDIRKAAGYVIMTLADAAALHNHDYYHFGLKKQFENLQNNFPDAPKSIADNYRKVIEAVNTADVVKYTLKMFGDVCDYLNIICDAPEMSEGERVDLSTASSESRTDGVRLAELYEEIISTFNKVYVCCEDENYILAFLSAVCLQIKLDGAVWLGCPKYDLLSGFNYTELGKLSAEAKKIENDFIQLIAQNGGHIKKYDSFEQFEIAERTYSSIVLPNEATAIPQKQAGRDCCNNKPELTEENL